MKEIVKDILLENRQIADLMDSLDESLEKFNVKGQDLIRLKLSVEEVLLNFRDRFGSEKKAKLTIRSRFGVASLTVNVAGEPFNPLLASQEDEDGEPLAEHSPGILFNIGLSTQYQYRRSGNTVLFPLPKKEINSAWFLVIALVGAVVLGLVGNRFSDGVRENVNIVLTACYDIVFGLITMFAAPMVFFTMITGVCEIGDINQLKSFGKRVLGGFFSPYIGALVVCVALPFIFPLKFGDASASGGALQSIADALTGIVPSNFISPFANGDFAQIVVTALILGIGTLILAQEVPAVLAFITQLNRVISMILDYLCMLIPVIIFITVVQMIWSGEISVVATAWKPILFSLGWAALLLLGQVLLCAGSVKEKPGAVFKKCMQLLITAMTTASISACYSTMDRTAQALKSDKKTAGFALPIGMMVFGGGEFVLFLTLAVYFGCVSGIDITPAWLILAVILSAIFSVAIPPVAGGPVVVLSIMLGILNIPTVYIGIAGAVGLLMDYPCTAVRATGVVLVASRTSAKQNKK